MMLSKLLFCLSFQQIILGKSYQNKRPRKAFILDIMKGIIDMLPKQMLYKKNDYPDIIGSKLELKMNSLPGKTIVNSFESNSTRKLI